jgi:hypothetical protein
MKNSDIAFQRLQHQYLSNPKFETAQEVVSWLVAVQAQDYAGARWALGSRLREASDDAIEQAFADGAILRTHLLRPTWHFVTPADIRWLLALTAPRVHVANAYMYQKSGLDSAIFKRSQAALVKALRGGQQLTRDELREVFQRAGIATEGEQRMVYLLMQAELEGVICSGARRGKQCTYALLEDRVPPAKPFDRDEALAELSRRYFLSRGPATVHDFAKWSGLTISDARRGVEAVQAQLSQVRIDGQSYWLSGSTSPVHTTPPTAHLLSIYDEYISGYKDRSAIGDPGHAALLVAMGNDLTAIILVNGRIVGTWKRTLKREVVIVELNLFISPTRSETSAIQAAAQRYGVFLNRTVELSYSTSAKTKRKG